MWMLKKGCASRKDRVPNALSWDLWLGCSENITEASEAGAEETRAREEVLDQGSWLEGPGGTWAFTLKERAVRGSCARF